MIICIGPFCIPVMGLFGFILSVLAAWKDRLWAFFAPTAATPPPTVAPHPKKTDSRAAPRLIELESEDQFAQLLLEEDALLVGFSATWCVPCKKIKPHVAQLSQHYPEVCFVTVDTDQFEDLSARFKVNVMPTFVGLVQGGKERGRVLGAMEHDLDQLAMELAGL